MVEQFSEDYASLLGGNSEALPNMKEYLRSLDENGKDQLREQFHLNLRSMIRIEDVELFQLMTDILIRNYSELMSLVPALTRTANREKQYALLQEKIKVFLDAKGNTDYSVDLTGSDLAQLRLEALSFLANTGKTECKVYIGNYQNLEDVLRHGFIPSFRVYDIIKETSDVEIILEHPDAPVETLEYFYGKWLPKSFHLFIMPTEMGAMRMYTENDNTTSILRWTYPHLLYSSQRMRTDMSMFRTPFSNTGLVINQTLKTDFGSYSSLKMELNSIFNGKYYLPVTRYASSLDEGLYHGKPTKRYCGTFYYHEPESTTMLLAENILVAETKYAAVKYFLESFSISTELHESATEIADKYLKRRNEKWENGFYKLDLIYTPQELIDHGLLSQSKLRGQHLASEVPQVPIYVGKVIDLYAKEDVFDQPLCLLAKEAGIDLVVLTRMVGAKQIVTEVLDARSREDSFKNLVFT